MDTNAEAIEVTLSALHDQLHSIDEAYVQAVRSIAAALDADPSRSMLWREYRELIKELTSGHDDGGAADVAADMSPDVGDAPPG